jgi:hypothetical protein
MHPVTHRPAVMIAPGQTWISDPIDSPYSADHIMICGLLSTTGTLTARRFRGHRIRWFRGGYTGTPAADDQSVALVADRPAVIDIHDGIRFDWMVIEIANTGDVPATPSDAMLMVVK